MSCQQLYDALDDYIDGICPDAGLLDRHIAGCGDCRRRVERERQLRNALAAYGRTSVPTPAPDFFDRAIATAIRTRHARQLRKSWLKGFGSALAASFAIWLIASDRIDFGDAPIAPMPQVTIALEQPRTVNLVFSAAADLDSATMTVSLPAGIEIPGFQGQREISWVTSLREGRNVLPLKLIALSPQGGEMVAKLQHDGDDKIFRLRLNVTQGTS